MRRGAALALVTVAVAGCGGDKALSAKDYRAKANAICAKVTAERERITPAQDLEQLRAAARTTTAINTIALRRLRELKPPDELKARHDVIVARLAQTIALQQQALKAGPRSRLMQRINLEAARAHATLVQTAQRAELADCARL